MMLQYHVCIRIARVRVRVDVFAENLSCKDPLNYVAEAKCSGNANQLDEPCFYLAHRCLPTHVLFVLSLLSAGKYRWSRTTQ